MEAPKISCDKIAAETTGLSITVGIATVGRPAILRETLRSLTKQTRHADRIIVSAPTWDDVDRSVENEGVAVEYLIGERGLTIQRNCIMKAAKDDDVIVFFDDDFVAAHDYLAHVELLFRNNPDIAMSTGWVLADGIIGPGISFAEAEDLLTKANAPIDPLESTEVYNGYGCNMAVRASSVMARGIIFDENLPLYGWLEDVDFSRQLAPSGRIVLCRGTRGVHLGVKKGRQPGARLGYSQVANPIYLTRKGSMAWHRAFWIVGRNLTMNLVFVLRPEPFVDRSGRLSGNLKGIADLILGKLHPNRIHGL